MTSSLKQLVLAIPLLFWFCFAYVKGTTAYDYVKELIDFQRKDTTAPSQVHLAFGHDSSQEITVSWVTSDKTESTVSYGPNPWNLDHVATGSSSQYNFRSFYYGSYTSGHIHHVTITGLTPDTKYYYRISAQGAGASAFQPPILGGPIGVADTFTTEPPPGPGAAFEPFSFAVIGDLGQTADSECTVTQVGRDPAFRFVVHAGDLAYADCFQPRWDTFGELVAPVARRLPWMVVPGNHEIEYDAISNTTFLAYEARFRMPQVAPARFLPAAPTSKMDYFSCQPSEVVGCYDFGNSFYSFQAGPVHFLMLNAYTRAGEGSEQLAWVRRDLAAVDRARFPWVVAVTHCPWYHSNAAHHEEPHTAEMRAGLEGLFLRAGVNLVVAGHVHAYERTRPHFQGTPQRGAPIYVTALQVLNGKYPESATSALQPNQAAAMRGGGGGGEPSTRLELDAWALQRTAREAEVLRRQDGARAAEVYAAAARGNQREERGGGGDHGGGGQEEERGGAGQKTLPRPASVPSVYQGASAYHGAGEGPLAARLRAARGGGAVMALQRSHSAGERPPSAGPRFRPASPFRFFVTQPEDDDEGIGDDVDGYVDDIVSVAASLKVPEVVKKPTAEKRPPLPTEEKNWALKTWITSDNVKATIKSVQRARAAFANDSEHGLLQYELASRRREIDPAEISSLSYKLGRSSTMMRLKAAEDKKSHRPATAGAAAKRGAPGGGQRARPSSAPPAAAAAGKKRPGTAKGKKKKATKKKAAPLVPKPPEIKWASAEEFMQAKFPRVAAMSVAQHAAAREIEDVRARFQAAGLADPGEALERALGVPSDRPAEVCLAGLRPQGAGLGKDHLRLDSPRKKKKKIVKKKKLTRRKKGGSRSRSSSRSVARRSKSPGKIKRR